MKQVKIFYYSIRSYILIISYFSISIYYIGYVKNDWWMSVCALLVGFIQMIVTSFAFIDGDDGSTNFKYELIDPDTFPQVIKKHERIRICLISNAIILSLLDLFPLYAMSERFMGLLGDPYNIYEGGIITFAAVLITIGFNFAFPITNNNAKLIESDFEEYRKCGKTACDKDDERILDNEKAEKEKQNKITEIKKNRPSLYGSHYKEIVYRSDYTLPEEYFIVSEENKMLEINYKSYKFSDILDFKVNDEEDVIYTPAKYETKTNTGSMIGRAVVGGVLTGGVGAIIGGATASKETNQIASASSKTIHDYKIIVYLNNISHSKEEILLGEDEDATQEIASVLTIIVNSNNEERNKSVEINNIGNSSSIADEIKKLADLKEQGILTDEEFNQQKRKLLNR